MATSLFLCSHVCSQISFIFLFTVVQMKPAHDPFSLTDFRQQFAKLTEMEF